MRRHPGRTGVLLAVLAAPALATAGPVRISLAPVRGDSSGVVARQVRSLLCRRYQCVPVSKLRRHGRLDFDRVESLQVAGIVVGTVASGRRGGRELEVALLQGSLQPVWRSSYPLAGRGFLSRESAADFAHELESRLGGEAPLPAAGARPSAPPEPPLAVPAPPAAAPPPIPAEPPLPALAAAPPREPARSSASSPAGRPTRARERSGARLLGAVEAGLSLGQRRLGYGGVPAGGGAPLGYQATLFASPRLHAELYPASLVTEGVLAGLGLFADYDFSVGLTTDDPAGGASHPTSLTRLGVGALWRFHPVADSQAAIEALLSYQHLAFSVGGAPIPGLPKADLSGVKAGLDAEIPVGGAVTLLLGAGYVKWTTARDLVGEGFFPGGRAYALEADAGVSVALGGALSLRALGGYCVTRYSLGSGWPYQASSATDQLPSARATLRMRF